MRKEDTLSFLSDFLNVRAAPILDSFRDWAASMAGIIDASTVAADHFSYKCREVREYAELLSRFEEYTDGWSGCRFLHQTVISGRLVSVIGLTDSISTPLGALKFLELSEPKPMSADTGGFDHVEIYRKPTQYTPWAELEELAELLNARSGARFVKKGRRHHSTWDAVIARDPSREDRQDFILRLTEGPLIEKIAQEMR